MILDLLTPFDTVLVEHSDYGAGDTDAEIRNLWQRQRALQSMVDGTLDVETFLDILEGQAINPTDYVDAALDNIDFLMRRSWGG